VAAALCDVVISKDDCRSRAGVAIERNRDDATQKSFSKLIAGRVILHNLYYTNKPGTIVRANDLITPRAAREIARARVKTVQVRSPLACRARRGICARCYGVDPATGRLAKVGATIGAKAALAIGPALHALKTLTQPFLERPLRESATHALCGGIVSLRGVQLALVQQQQRIVVSPGGTLEVIGDDAVVESHRVPHGALVHVATGDRINSGSLLASWSPQRWAIFASDSGTLQVQRGVNGEASYFQIINASGEARGGCVVPATANVLASDGARVEVGDLLANFPYGESVSRAAPTSRFDRLKRLLEAAPPRDRALLAEAAGCVELAWHDRKSHCAVLVNPADGSRPRKYYARALASNPVIVRSGQWVEAGERLTGGPVFLGDLIRIRGRQHVQPLLLAEIYALLAELRSNRPDDDRPWELLATQMLGYVRVESSGDTRWKPGYILPRSDLMSVNRSLRKKIKVRDRREYPFPLESNVVSRQVYGFAEKSRLALHPGTPLPVTIPWPAGWSDLLLGLDEIARQGGFLTTACFAPTRDALIRATLDGRRSELDRIQERVLAGRLMRGGSGWPRSADDED
jgi:DNA-directed RNA polymerase subunit beta'